MTLDEFIAFWDGSAGGAERANYARFLEQLIGVLGLPPVPPGAKNTETPDYGYEARVSAATPHGTVANGRVDLYKRGHFIVEAKQSHIPPATPTGNLALFDPPATPQAPSGARYDKLMREAFDQAKRYAAAVPPSHGWPPFIIVCDVGRAFEIYYDWSGIGKNYSHFPDPATYRIALADLRHDWARDRLRAIWTDPRSIDPRLKAVEVTRNVARDLAEISQYLELAQRGRIKDQPDHARSLVVEETSLFVMRLLFCMFAEDVGLLPRDRFKDFLARCLPADWREAGHVNEALFRRGLAELWTTMGRAGGDRYVLALETEVRHFNGGLFADATVFPLDTNNVARLIAAAGADWTKVEPAIFGTLLEQALTPAERAKLGAHYTPRPYVERLVEATIMEPLRAEFAALDTGADASTDPGPLTAFLARLQALRVLDPACGTGNFLYVAMELLLRLESDCIVAIEQRGGTAVSRIGPQQFHGLELNPRAAVIAELVLWIGWLRWRMSHAEGVGDPVLQRFDTINFGQHGGYDAVLARLPSGEIDTVRPRPPAWPEADYIVGNPPFIGGKDLRARLGGDYAETLWKANPGVPKSADFVMQWWDRAAEVLTRPETRLRRFGFVTTNSITQSFSRRVIGARLSALHLVIAIPDHPWTLATRDAAAVRIAMTVAEAGAGEGCLLEVVGEHRLDTDAPQIEVRRTTAVINADLSVGADVTAVRPLLANEGLCSPGVKLHGAGFIVMPTEARALGLGVRPGLEAHIKPYRNGRDLLQRPRGAMVIDLYGVSERDARTRFPEVYAHLLTKVKPERDLNRRATYKTNWWIFGEPRGELRPALIGLARYIATVETATHRIFQFIAVDIVADNKNIIIASDDAFDLGVLMSSLHVQWSTIAGGWLGVGNDPVYVKSRCFDPFPFPDPTPAQRAAIADLGEELDATRKAVQAEHPEITLTGLYNLVEKLKAGTTLDLVEADTARRARAAIVLELHRCLDAAVAAAYGWPADLGAEQIVANLVALNAARAAEEAGGHVRWLRPDYQRPRFDRAGRSGE